MYAIRTLLFDNMDFSVVDVLEAEIAWCVTCGIYCCESCVPNLIHGFGDRKGLRVERRLVFFCGRVYWLSACVSVSQFWIIFWCLAHLFRLS